MELQDHCTFHPKTGPDNPFVSGRTLKQLAAVVSSPKARSSAPPPPPTRRKSSLLFVGQGGIQYSDAVEEEKSSIQLTPMAQIYFYNPEECPSPDPPVHIPLAPPLPLPGVVIAAKKDNRIKIVKGEKRPPPKEAPGGMGALLAELNAKLLGKGGGVQLKKVERKVGKLSGKKKGKKPGKGGFTDLIDELAFTLARLKRGAGEEEKEEEEESEEEEEESAAPAEPTRVSIVNTEAVAEQGPPAEEAGPEERSRRGAKIGAHALIHENFAPGVVPREPSTLEVAKVRDPKKVPKAPLLPGMILTPAMLSSATAEKKKIYSPPPTYVPEEKGNESIPTGYYLPAPSPDLVEPGQIKKIALVGERPDLDEMLRELLYITPTTASPLPTSVTRKLMKASSLAQPRASFARQAGIDLYGSVEVVGDEVDSFDGASIISDAVRNKIAPGDMPVPSGYYQSIEKIQKGVQKRAHDNDERWRNEMRNYHDQEELEKIRKPPADQPTKPKEFSFPTTRRKRDKVISFRRPPESVSPANLLPFSGFIKESSVINSSNSQVFADSDLGVSYWAVNLRNHSNQPQVFFEGHDQLVTPHIDDDQRLKRAREVESHEQLLSRYQHGDQSVVSRGGCIRSYPLQPRDKAKGPSFSFEERIAKRREKKESLRRREEERQRELEREEQRRKEFLRRKAKRVASLVQKENGLSHPLPSDEVSSSYLRSVRKGTQVYAQNIRDSGVDPSVLHLTPHMPPPSEYDELEEDYYSLEDGEESTNYQDTTDLNSSNYLSDEYSGIISRSTELSVEIDTTSRPAHAHREEKWSGPMSQQELELDEYMNSPSSYDFRRAHQEDEEVFRQDDWMAMTCTFPSRASGHPTPLMNFQQRKAKAEASIGIDPTAPSLPPGAPVPPLAVVSNYRPHTQKKRPEWTTSSKTEDPAVSNRVNIWLQLGEEGRIQAIQERRNKIAKEKKHTERAAQARELKTKPPPPPGPPPSIMGGDVQSENRMTAQGDASTPEAPVLEIRTLSTPSKRTLTVGYSRVFDSVEGPNQPIDYEPAEPSIQDAFEETKEGQRRQTDLEEDERGGVDEFVTDPIRSREHFHRRRSLSEIDFEKRASPNAELLYPHERRRSSVDMNRLELVEEDEALQSSFRLEQKKSWMKFTLGNANDPTTDPDEVMQAVMKARNKLKHTISMPVEKDTTNVHPEFVLFQQRLTARRGSIGGKTQPVHARRRSSLSLLQEGAVAPQQNTIQEWLRESPDNRRSSVRKSIINEMDDVPRPILQKSYSTDPRSNNTRARSSSQPSLEQMNSQEGASRLRAQSSFDSQESPTQRRNSSIALSERYPDNNRAPLQRQHSNESHRRGSSPAFFSFGQADAFMDPPPPVPRSEDGSLLGLDDLYVSGTGATHNRDNDSDSYMLYDSQGRQSPRGRVSLDELTRQRSGSAYVDSTSQPPSTTSRHHSITPFSAGDDSPFQRSNNQRSRTTSAPEVYAEQQRHYQEGGGRGRSDGGRLRAQSSHDPHQTLQTNQRRQSRRSSDAHRQFS
jgi:hypothetical protein